MCDFWNGDRDEAVCHALVIHVSILVSTERRGRPQSEWNQPGATERAALRWPWHSDPASGDQGQTQAPPSTWTKQHRVRKCNVWRQRCVKVPFTVVQLARPKSLKIFIVTNFFCKFTLHKGKIWTTGSGFYAEY